MSGALDGIKVVDLSRILAGPYCTQMLSDLGAEVVKVEAPRGDDTRQWGPPFLENGVAAYHLSCNRGKEIIQCDLKKNPEKVLQLLEEADVLVENFKPGGLEKLIGPPPKHLIVCSISGFGKTGPRSSEPGYDLALQALSGIMSITGEVHSGPVKVGVAWIDIITGLYAGNAILAALFHRERTGIPQNIDISLWDCAIASLANQGQNFLTDGQIPKRMGSSHPNLVPYQAFLALDGWVVIAVGNESQWGLLCEKLDIKSVWPSNSKRIAHRKKVCNLIQDKVHNMSMKMVVETLQGIPCTPINDIAQALQDPQSIARKVTWKIGKETVLSSPLRFMSVTPARPKN